MPPQTRRPLCFQVALEACLRKHSPMKIVVSGASGLIGSALVPFLRAAGHDVQTLVRRSPRNSSEIEWNPAAGVLNPAALSGVDAVINLSGAGVGDKRWTADYKNEIMQSRTLSTSTLARAIVESVNGPRILINGSAIGFYGNRGQERIDESSTPAEDFLARVVVAWEASAAPAIEAGVRVVFARTGLVVSAQGGAFGKLLPLFKLGLGGIIGNGRQYWPLISLTDELRAIEFLLTHDVQGPVNLTAPTVPTNKEVMRTLAALLKRPAILPVPGFALRIVLGEFADGITGGAQVLPTVLKNAGFNWNHPSVEAIIRGEILGR